MKTIIAFTGPTKSGKSYFAEFLAREIVDSKMISFADPLKRVLENMSSSYEEMKNREIMPGITGRDLMVGLANRAKELYGDTYFANLLIQKINESDAGVIIVDDLRFKVEEEALKTLPYKVIIVKVISHIKPDYEVDKIDADITINNKHNEAKVDDVVKTILTKIAEAYLFSSRSSFPETEIAQRLYMVYDSLKKIFNIPNVKFYVVGEEIIKARVNIRGKKIPIADSVLKKAIALAGQKDYLYVKEV